MPSARATQLRASLASAQRRRRPGHVVLVLVLLATVVSGVPATPVSASPTAVEVRVGSGADDAEEDRRGQVDLVSSDLELIEEGGSPQVVGMRFPGVQVPPGATITDTYVQFTVDEADTGTTDLVVRAEASADPSPFAAADGDISSRPVTAAAATWSPPPWTTVGAAGSDQRTSDLSAVVQEVVDHPRWASGNAIALVVTGSGERTAESFDGDAASAPVLHVEYTDTGNTRPEVSIASPVDGSSLPDDEDVLLSGSASDAEDGDVSDSLRWSSDRVGDLGVGASVSTRLPVGTHVLTATATDSAGARASTSVTVTMTGADPILVGAGDISRCSNDFDTATAELILDLPEATVFTAGDNAYRDGSPEEFAQCYDPTWGQFKDRTRPAVGNHEYRTPDASGYFDYFGSAAGDPATGYYSYDVGTWHVVVLNSNCNEVGGCGASSPQGRWLAADLAASPAACTVAFWHHARFSSGSSHGSDADYVDFWNLLDDAGATMVVGGHDHHYERFARQDAAGNADPGGMRQFVVGTGGTSLNPLGEIQPNSQYANDVVHGVLMLVLRDGSYDWEFRSIPNGVALDSGSEACGSGTPPPVDEAPTVSITSPADGATFADGEPVTFTATADDAEDGAISTAVEWTSSIDGLIGSGAAFTTDGLSAGDHVVTAQVTDSAGNTVSASVAVTIEVAEPPANSLAQTGFRVRADDGVPLDADDAWAAALNSGADADMEERFRIRFEVVETAGTSFSGRFALQYRRNGGTWADVPVAPDDGAERAVREVEVWDSARYGDGDPTGDVLERSTTPFVAGVGLERTVTPPMTLESQHTELEWTLKIRKFHEDGVNAEGDRFEFRVVQDGGAPLGAYAAPAVVSLVHPPGLIGGTHVENPNRIGPFADSNGNLYYVAEPTEFDNQMMMLKSTDGGATWLEVDKEDRPATDDLESLDIRQDGDTLHIAHHPGGSIVYHTFHMSGSASTPDNWGVRDEVVDSGFDEPDQATALEVLSDGRIRVFYGVTAGSNDAIHFKTRSAAGTWDASPSVLDDEPVDWHWVTTVRADEGPNRDRVFIFSFEDTAGHAYLRTLDPDGTLSERTPVQTLATGADHRQPILPPVYWNDGGEDRVLVAYKKDGDTLHSRLISGTAPGPEVQASDQRVDRNRGASRQPVADLVAHDAVAHLLYADAATYDLWTDATGGGDGIWGTDTEVIDDVRVNWVRGSVFEHSVANGGNTVYGYAYEDHDTAVAGYATGYIRYAEMPLGQQPPPPPPEPPPSSEPPTADAGPDQTVADSDGDGAATVQLDASGSVPGDGAITGYEWFDGGTSIATGPTPTVRLDVGTHLLTLQVTDSNGLTDSDTVTVTVTVDTADPISYLSFESSTTVPGIGTVNDLDIVGFDRATGDWAMYFDASDVGMTRSDLSAFHVRADGSVLMSVSADGFAVPGLTGGPDGEQVDDSDVFVFTPTSIGETTAGSFAFHFDGSDVGLGSSDGDIDALSEFPDGSLGVSTVRSVAVAGVGDAADEDVLRFTGAFGARTAGTWSKYFDGGDAGLSRYGEDVDAISFDGADLLFSTTGSGSTLGTDSNDIIRFAGSYEPVTSGTTALELDPSDHGIGRSADVDGLHHAG